MGKLLLWVVLIALAWLGWTLFRVSQRKAQARERVAARPQPDLEAGSAQPESMTRCAKCGVYLPAGEALSEQGHDYCSAAHRDAATRKP